MKSHPKNRIILLFAILLIIRGAQSQVISALTNHLDVYELSGVRVRAGFVPENVSYVLGERLQVSFLAQNLGPTNFTFFFGGDYRRTGRHDRFKITAIDPDGKSARDPKADNWGMGGGLGNFVQLQPGQFFTNEIDVAQFRVLDKPGVYTIDCSFAFDDRGPAQTNQPMPAVHSRFELKLLDRTPESVATVIEELLAKARETHGPRLGETFSIITEFGKEAAVPYLANAAKTGSLEFRQAAISRLPSIPTEASLAIGLNAFEDPEPAIRATAANSLGRFKSSVAVEALLTRLPDEKSPVREAIIVALGASQSERAFSVITNALESNNFPQQKAAIEALANFGGTNAVSVLQKHINTNFLAARYEITRVLAERLSQPIQAEWLVPVLMQREQTSEWYDCLRLFRMRTGTNAIPALLSCLDFDVAWSGRNRWILDEVQACQNPPHFEYVHDPNSNGTPEQCQKNQRTLDYLKTFAWPIPPRPEVLPALITPLKTDPPIDFKPTFQEFDDYSVHIESGFLKITESRDGGRWEYTPTQPYQSIYNAVGRFRPLVNDPDQAAAKWNISPAQMNQLRQSLNRFAVKLCGSHVSDQKIANFYNLLANNSPYCPDDFECSHRLTIYWEAPSWLKQEAKTDLINTTVNYSQNYHMGSVEFVNSVTNILSPSQIQQILH
jgi:hypothetical protein